MSLCDLCGKQTEPIKAVIENATLRVCKDCARYGKDIVYEKPEPKKEEKPAEQPKNIYTPSVDEDLIDEGYALLIKTAREKTGMTQEQLAKSIAEKESMIQKLETKQQRPTLKVAKKLEQFLRIKLIVHDEPKKKSFLKDVDFNETDMTIGDLLKLDGKFRET